MSTKTEQGDDGRDLRTRLLDAALGILDDPETPLELRKVAEAAGKSRTAPYLVFGKESEGGGLAALRMAVAAEGAQMLADRMDEARLSTDEPRLAFHRVARALFEFATERERLFRLMFGPEIGTIPLSAGLGPDGHPELRNLVEARVRGERVVLHVVRSAQAQKILPAGAPLRHTIAAWALLIGIAFLLLDRVLEAAGVETTVEQGADVATEILMGSDAESLTKAALALLAAEEEKAGTPSPDVGALYTELRTLSEDEVDGAPDLPPPAAPAGAGPASGLRPALFGRLRRVADEDEEEGGGEEGEAEDAGTGGSVPDDLRPAGMEGQALSDAGGIEVDDEVDEADDEGAGVGDDRTDEDRGATAGLWSMADAGSSPGGSEWTRTAPREEASLTRSGEPSARDHLARVYEQAGRTISAEGSLRRAALVAPALRGARVLWIDDHPKGILWERRTLEELGVSVAPAWSTRVALERLAEEPFDLIISDIARGDRDDEGVRALPLLRQAQPDTPVVFYVARLIPGRGPPEGSLGITNRVGELLHLVLDVLERRRL